MKSELENIKKKKNSYKIQFKFFKLINIQKIVQITLSKIFVQ